MSILKSQLSMLETLNRQLRQVVGNLKEAKQSFANPSLLDYLAPDSMFSLEQQNSKLRAQIEDYEKVLTAVHSKVSRIMQILDECKEGRIGG